MEKFLLFTTGGGSTDPLNLNSDESAVYSVNDFKGMKPADARSVDLFFDTNYGKEIVTLGVKNGTHSKIMQSISNAIVSGNQSIIPIADVDSNRFVNKNIHSVKIKTQELHCQKITGAADLINKINLGRRNYSSCLATNTTTVNVRLSLFLTSQVGTDITDTGANVNLAGHYDAGDTSVAVNGSFGSDDAARSDLFLNERVYKQDGTFIGICTAIHSTGTPLTFAAGLEGEGDDILLHTESLHTGTRYDILKELKIPRQDTLKLESNEISFDNSIYELYARSNKANGHVTLIFHY